MGLSDQASDKGIASIEKQYRAEMKEVSQLLRRHPDSRAHVIRFMKKAGWDLEKSPQKLAQSREQAGKAKSAQTRSAQAAAARQEVLDNSDKIPSKYGDFNAMSTSCIQNVILPALDPVSLSGPNIQASYPKGSKGPEQKQIVLELLIFATGVPASFPLKGSMTWWSPLLNYLKEEARLRGRLEKKTTLPLNYEEKGVYKILELTSDDELIVSQRFTGAKAKVQLSDFIRQPNCKKNVEYYIRDNYDEKLACIAIRGEDKIPGIALFNKFATQYKQRPAIENVYTPTKRSPAASSPKGSASSRKRQRSS